MNFNLKRLLRSLLHKLHKKAQIQNRGAGLIEYALLLAVISTSCISSIDSVTYGIKRTFMIAHNSLPDVESRFVAIGTGGIVLQHEHMNNNQEENY